LITVPPAPSVEPTSAPKRTLIGEQLAEATPRIWVMPMLVGLNVVGFGVETALGASPTSPTIPQLRAAGAEFGVSVMDGDWWRPISAMFLHSGFSHLFFNMVGLVTVGMVTERAFGNLPFLFLYLASGLAASLVSLWVHPMSVSTGASGAIFGVFGACLVFLLQHRQTHAVRFPLWMRLPMLAFVAYTIYGGITTPDEHIDVAGHGGGLVMGVFAGVLLARNLARPAENLSLRIVAAVGIACALLIGGFVVEGRLGTNAKVHEFRAVQAAAACGTGWRDAKSPAAREAAVKVCSDAIALDPKSADLHAWRGSLYDDQDQEDLAVADANAAIALDKKETLAWRVRLHRDLVPAKADAAEVDCAALLEENEPGIAVLGMCSRLALGRGDRTGARVRLDRWVAVAPSDAVPVALRCKLNEQEGRLAESRTDCEAVVAVRPDDPTAWNYLAWVEVVSGDFAAARAHADRALAIGPEGGAYLGTRCFALTGLGEQKEARVACARAVELLPDNLIDRGMLAFLDNHYDDARRAWLEASGDPSVARELAPWIKRLPGH
jgi:membrane associated rhomboid family serine protease/tetratricopeptide (TPR) repeat protein